MRRTPALLAFFFAATAATTAHAQPGKEVAKRLFEEGVELEKKNDCAGALAKYREASQITVTAGLKFHEGYCLEMMGKLVDALAAYEKSIDLARQQNKAEVEKATAVRADALRRRVPQISIKVTLPNSAEVLLDGNPIGPALVDGRPFRIDSGEHVIVAHAPGYKELTRRVTAIEGATSPVELALEKSGTLTPGPMPLPDRDETTRDYTLPIVATAGSVTLVAGGILSFVVAGSSADNAKSDCAQQVTCDTPKGTIRTFDALAISGVLAGAGVGVLAVVLWTHGPKVRASASSVRFEGTF